MSTRFEEQMAAGGQFAPSIRISGLVQMLGMDLLIPFGGYYLARVLGVGVTLSLLISTVLAVVRLVYLMWRQGHADVFASFLLFLFAGGLALSFITGDARFLLLKSAGLTVLGGVVFLISAAVHKPITYAVAQRVTANDRESRSELARGWSTSVAFRKGFYAMALAWGAALLLSGLAQIWLVYALRLDLSVALTNVLALAVFAGLGGWNVWFIERARTLAREAATPPPGFVHASN